MRTCSAPGRCNTRATGCRPNQVEDPRDLVRSVRRIGEWPQDVGTRCGYRVLCTGGMLHGAMVIGGEHEADARGLRQRHPLRLQVDGSTQGLEHIRTARAGRDAAPAMHVWQHGRRPPPTNMAVVEMLKVWAPSPPVPQVNQMGLVFHQNRRGELTHDLGCRRDFPTVSS